MAERLAELLQPPPWPRGRPAFCVGDRGRAVAVTRPSGARQVSADVVAVDRRATATWSPTSISSRPSASRPYGETASSSSSDGLIPARSAATSSAFAICFDDVPVADLRLHPPERGDRVRRRARDPSAAAAVFASRSSRASLLDPPEVPKWRPMRRSALVDPGVHRAAAAHTAPRRMSTLGSVSAGPDVS